MAPGTTEVHVDKMELTPQRVSWDDNDLGGTKAGVTVETTFTKGEIKADQYGTTVLDRRLNGFSCKITLELAEVRSLDKMAVVFPNAILTGTAPAAQSLTFRLPIGASDLDASKTLNLHPLVADDADVSNDFNFPKAFPSEESSIKYDPENQSSAKLVFNIYPFLTGTDQPIFFKFGDPSVGPTMPI